MDKVEEAIKEYRKKFKSSFPLSAFKSYEPDDLVELINRCIFENKDVYDIGILNLNDMH